MSSQKWNKNEPWKADFSSFILHTLDENNQEEIEKKSVSFDVVNGIEEYKDIIDSIIWFWGDEKYMKEYVQAAKLTKSDLNIMRFSSKAIEDLKFLQDFHTRVYDWGYQHALSLETKKSIKDYPHIYEWLKLYWGKPKDFHEFIESKWLTVQDRDRGWFSPQVLKELQGLIDIHNKRFWLPERKTHDFEVHKDNWNIDNKTR